jgi:hypothetical protein
MNHLPNSSFLQSRSARIGLARKRFFEEDNAPTAWSARNLRVLGSMTSAARQPTRAGQLPAHNGMPDATGTAEVSTPAPGVDGRGARLASIFSTAPCAAMLIDAGGVLIGSSCVARSHEALMPVARRLAGIFRFGLMVPNDTAY